MTQQEIVSAIGKRQEHIRQLFETYQLRVQDELDMVDNLLSELENLREKECEDIVSNFKEFISQDFDLISDTRKLLGI